MDQKPKTRGSTKKTAKPKAKEEKQFARFIETARELGADDPKTFERVFKKIVSSKQNR